MALDDNIRVLGRLSLFAGFEAEALRLIAFAARSQKFGPGDVVYRVGETSDGGYLIVSGSIRLESDELSARKERIVGPGRLLGERALLTETVNSATAIAQKNTATLHISRDLLRRVLEEFPVSAEGMRDTVKSQLRELGINIENSRRALST